VIALDAAVRPYCIVATALPDEVEGVVDDITRRRLLTDLEATLGDARSPQPRRVLVQGPSLVGKTRLVGHFARVVGYRSLLLVEASTLPKTSDELATTLELIGREAYLTGALTVIQHAENLGVSDADLVRLFRTSVLHLPQPVVLTSTRSELPIEALELSLHIELAQPSLEVCFAGWQTELRQRGLHLADDDLCQLAKSAQLPRAAIAQAIRHATHRDGSVTPTLTILRQCARLQVRSRLDRMAKPMTTRHGLDDLVLSSDLHESIVEIITAANVRARILLEWGLDAAFASGKGVITMFNGPPGTGKTFAAGVIAHELALPLHRIDVSTLVDRFVGETEKHLVQLFAEAHSAQAILLFDEADSLFAKRVAVKDANDRFANMQVNLLLNLIEDYEGVVILTTNLANNLDHAFARRIQYKVRFELPEADERLTLWRKHLPREVPRDSNLDLREIADKYAISGGNIRNAVLRAASIAEGRLPISNEILRKAIQRELIADGRVVQE
jgi:AAA+ superfamily predicted ATPase